ncbi:MAG: sugar kinase [Candidatus Latescibacteria bacterium]|nr:sugar kinase [Candidatus Latescibacterota bacterium]
MSIVVVGSIALDDVVTQNGSIKNAPGGSSLFFSAAASLFAPVYLVGVVGDDFPREEIEFLERRQVNLDGLSIIRGGKTFRWAGEYEIDMNKRRTTNLELNVFLQFDPVLPDNARRAPYVFLGNIGPQLQMKVLDQVENPKLVALDTMECYINDNLQALKEVLQRIDLLFINDSEAQLLAGTPNLMNAARKLLGMGPRYVVIKKGEHGSMLFGDNLFFTVPAYPVENVIDPTGAGDSYAGGAMGYIAMADLTTPSVLKKAIVYGGLIASFSVQDFSLNALKNTTNTDIEQRMTEFRSLVSF